MTVGPPHLLPLKLHPLPLGSGDRVGWGVEAVAADRNLAFQEPGLRTTWCRLLKPLMVWLGEMRVCWRAMSAFSGRGRKW